VAFTVTADSFPSLVRREFAYLVDDFSCLIQEKLYGAEPFSDGVIDFWCDKVVVSVELDRFDVIVSIRPPSEPEIARIGLQTAVAYLTKHTVTKIIDKTAAPSEYEAGIKYQIVTYAALMREYCAPVFRETFTEWLAMMQLALREMQEDYKRLTGKSLPSNEPFTAYVKAKSQ
jgi:hypothetical protein